MRWSADGFCEFCFCVVKRLVGCSVEVSCCF